VHLVRSVLFERRERQVLREARAVLDTVHPPEPDPSTPPDLVRHVKGPSRAALTDLGGPGQPVSYDRLRLARTTLVSLLAKLGEQATPEYWDRIGGGQLSAKEQQMVTTLVAERTSQVAVVSRALELVEEALRPMTAYDDPAWCAQNLYRYD